MATDNRIDVTFTVPNTTSATRLYDDVMRTVEAKQREIDGARERRRRDMHAQLAGGLLIGVLIGAVALRLGGWWSVAGFVVACGATFYHQAR
jgi:hypothetical protein